MTNDLLESFRSETAALTAALEDLEVWYSQIAEVVETIREAFAAGKIVYAAGNGGSATLAQHLSDEMVGRFRKNRSPYPVVALTADSAVITCIGNDFGFDEIFSRQVSALGHAGDVLIAYSTSGRSANVVKACQTARQIGMHVVTFSGSEGELKDLADIAVISPATETARIQELDLHAIHLICHALEPAS